MRLTPLVGLCAIVLAACALAAQDPAPSTVASIPDARTLPDVSAFAPVTPPAVLAQVPEEQPQDPQMDARIDRILGNHVAYRSVLTRLQAAVAEGDCSGVAALVRYPIEVQTLSGTQRLENAHTLVMHYEDVITPTVARAIAAQRYDSLFVSANGVMVGAGEVWLNGVCHDRQCVDVDVKVISFQQGG